MCDHCSTFKPLLEGPDPARFYETDRPPVVPTPSPRTRRDAPDTGCCSWRQTCCDGRCCNRVGNCCSPEPEQPTYTRTEKPALPRGYCYGYQPATPSYSLEMTAAAMPDRVPCRSRREEKKLPMCYGGDCQDSAEGCASKPDESESTPRQSER